MRVRARRTAIALCAVMLAAVPACGGDDGDAGAPSPPASAPDSTAGGSPAPSGTQAPQRLTLVQAQTFASMRAANYRIGQSGFQTTVPDRGSMLSVRGVVDWQRHVGSAVYTTEAGRTDPSANGLMQWNFEYLSAHAGGAVEGPPPPPEADGTWVQRRIDPAQSTIDALLLLVLSVANQEADNPQLLQQSDAAYLGRETLAGRETSVFAGPTSDAAIDPSAPAATDAKLTYWIGDDGALVRMRADLGGTLVGVDFFPAPDTPTEFLPDLLPGA